MSRFSKGLIANYISVIVLAASGFLYNSIIILFYDAESLGIFNLSYAYYIVLSQLSVFGIHVSILKDTSSLIDDEVSRGDSLTAACLLTAIWSVAFSSLTGAIIGFIPMKSDLMCAVYYSVMALPFFSLNKVFLNYMNGLSMMTMYAFLQVIRNLLIIIFILGVSAFHLGPSKLSASFLFAEICLFIICSVVFFHKKYFSYRISWSWMKQHALFGAKILPSNIVIELNSKVDVICLGMLLNSEALLGIYSFANLFAEGYYQVFAVYRRSFNPIFVETSGDNPADLCLFIKKNVIRLKIISSCMYILIVAAYLVCVYVFGWREYLAGLVPVCIICAGILCNHKYILLGNCLSLSGFPTEESVVNILTVVSNCIINILLIGRLGIYGAAVGTTISHFVYSIATRRFIDRRLRYQL